MCFLFNFFVAVLGFMWVFNAIKVVYKIYFHTKHGVIVYISVYQITARKYALMFYGNISRQVCYKYGLQLLDWLSKKFIVVFVIYKREV